MTRRTLVRTIITTVLRRTAINEHQTVPVRVLGVRTQ
jgi:hypothetical protein